MKQIYLDIQNEELVRKRRSEILEEVKIYKVQPQKPKKKLPDTTPMFIRALEEVKEETISFPYLSQDRLACD